MKYRYDDGNLHRCNIGVRNHGILSSLITMQVSLHPHARNPKM